jgi:hypothetical protein
VAVLAFKSRAVDKNVSVFGAAARLWRRAARRYSDIVATVCFVFCPLRRQLKFGAYQVVEED